MRERSIRSPSIPWLLRIALVVVALGPMASARADDLADNATPTPAIAFPGDDAPHNGLTEWWYFTGHLETPDGARYGFEQVTFKGRRRTLSGYAAHAAITDVERGFFVYDQRSVVENGQVSRAGAGFDLTIGNWSMRGAEGHAALRASIPGYDYDLTLTALKPAVLHGGDGYVRTKTGVESAYYSRTRLAVVGTLTVDGVATRVTGLAWMDHQWGEFTQFSEGGWDWFALQLDDDRELMIYLLRDLHDVPSLLVASLVQPDGTVADLTEADVRVDATATWRSPASGATYPSAWTIELPSDSLVLHLVPVLANQELDTRATTQVTYWEGEVIVDGMREREPISGRGYVELTGYTRARDGAVP
jgi:predicted secreted hydrolase